MRTCLSCRAALREFRAMPERVASVLPPATLVASDGGGPLRGLAESAFATAQQKLESALGAAQTKAAAFGERVHAAAELATGQKLAAVAASAAALAGGGTAVERFSDHHALQMPSAKRVEAKPVKEEVAAQQTPPPTAEEEVVAPEPELPAPRTTTGPATRAAARPRNEFAPGGSTTSKPATTSPVPAQPAGADFAPTGGSGSGGSGEFAP
jgi:hypothetical protein